MTSPVSAALRFGAGALIAQLLLQFVWHAWFVPVSQPALALAVLPLLPGLWVCIRNLPRGVLIGGIVNLFYFCHGVVELLGAGTSRLFAAAEVALAVAVVAALGWELRRAKAQKNDPADPFTTAPNRRL
jgi:uncharacterized membrane protein